MMKSRRLRWTLGIGLVVVAIFGSAIAYVLIPDRHGRSILFSVLFERGKKRPPAMFADQLSGPNLSEPAETSRQLTARLQQQFPLGTTEDALKAALFAQGFEPLPPPPLHCVQPVQQGRPVDVGQTVAVCPPQDERKSLQYQWGNGTCAATITVRWSADDHQTVTLLDGYYHSTCP